MTVPHPAHPESRQRLPRRALSPALLGAVLIAGPLTAQAPVQGTAASATDRVALTASAARTTTAPRVDGVLDEAAWRSAPVLTDFVQREPYEGRPSSERTEIRVLFDDEALYVGAWLFDHEPNAVVYGETRRDSELKDADAVVLVLDTYLDRQNGFLFATTPAGIEYDGQITREGQGGSSGPRRQQAGSGGGFNKNWDGSWNVATSRDDRGWYAEFRVPFSTLRYGGGGPQTWGLNVSRNIRRRNEESYWAPIPRQFNLYRVSLAGTLSGLEAPTQRVMTFTPYVLGSSRRDYVAGTGVATHGELGGDAKLGLTPSLTLDLTYNTDFAQVEVDEEQVNLSRFRLFFPEKRPFFLENAGTFAVGSPQQVELFFSRRIGIEGGQPVPIVGGGRLTGKAGGFTVGLLNIQTDEVSTADPLEPGQRSLLAPANNFSVVRALRELPNRSRLGATFVSRLNTGDRDDYNLTYGVDGRIGIGDAFLLDAYAAGTQTPERTGEEYAYSLGASYTSRDWRLAASFREVSEDFNPEVGFLTRPGHRFVSAMAMRAYRVPRLSWFRELRPHVVYREFFDLEGFSETRLLHIDSHFELANGAFFQLPALNFTREGLKEPYQIAPGIVVPAGTYDNFEWGFAYNTDRSAPLSVEGELDIGGFYSGRRAGGQTTLNTRFGEKLVAGLRTTYYDVHLDEGRFQTALLGLRVAYSFSPRVYLQSLIQYNDQTNNFSSNVRFGWLNTAGTGLFLVYNDAQRANLFDRLADRGPLERTLAVKFTRQLNLGR